MRTGDVIGGELLLTGYDTGAGEDCILRRLYNPTIAEVREALALEVRIGNDVTGVEEVAERETWTLPEFLAALE